MSRGKHALAFAFVLGLAIATSTSAQCGVPGPPNKLTVASQQKISAAQGGFTGLLENTGLFGASAASVGDFDGDGVSDLAVGAGSDLCLPKTHRSEID